MCETPIPSSCFASSSDFTELVCVHPFVETHPFLASIPTAIFPGNSLAASFINSGLFIVKKRAN